MPREDAFDSDELFRNLVEQALVGIFVLQNNRYAYANPRFAAMFGYAPAEIYALDNWLTLVADSDRAFMAEQLARRLRGEPPTDHYTYRGKRRDGAIIHVEVHGTRTMFKGKPASIASILDITERKLTEEKLRKTEEEVRQKQKMESIGRLAGGIAHDFNNLLTIISVYSDLLLDKIEPEDHSHEMVSEIQKAGTRAAALTRQLLAFSRRQVLEPKIVGLNDILADMKDMLRRLIPEDITLSIAPAPDLATVKADRGQMEQVIMNLAVNGRDAMPRGGMLTIETANVELGPSYAERYPEVRPGEYAMLAVTDTGIGMDEATKVQIFEPFFTTKDVGKGTGLGLSTVHGIIKQHDGHIAVYTEPAHGTTFKVYLPVQRRPERAAAVAPAPRTAPRGSETVLLVEDEPAVRALARDALVSCGYKVLIAPNGLEAVQVSNRHTRIIDLLVTDVVMPLMNGRQLYAGLLAMRPALKVLFVSGYTDDAVVRHGIVAEEMAFLQKPFTLRGLATKVREVLDRRP